jgi:hypothetical protein
MSNVPSARKIIEDLVRENDQLREALANADEAIEELCDEANHLEQILTRKQDELDFQSEQLAELLASGDDKAPEPDFEYWGIPVDAFMRAETIIADDEIIRDTIGLADKCRDLTEFKIRADIVIRDGLPIRLAY